MSELDYATTQLNRIIYAMESCYPVVADRYRIIRDEIMAGGNDNVISLLSTYTGDDEIGSNITAIINHDDNAITSDIAVNSDDCLNNLLMMILGIEPSDTIEYRESHHINSIADIWDQLDRGEKLLYHYYRQIINPMSDEEEREIRLILSGYAKNFDLSFIKDEFEFKRIEMTMMEKGTGASVINKLRLQGMIVGRINHEQDNRQWYGLVQLHPKMNVRIFNIVNY